MKISDLWHSTDPIAWDSALGRYWDFIKPQNQEIEEYFENFDLRDIRNLDAQKWYDFLESKYFKWKYTAPNRYKTSISYLKRHIERGTLDELDQIRLRLLSLDLQDVRSGLVEASKIHGLGTAGASGLLALMYPKTFGTVDQFMVKALRDVDDLPEAHALNRMNHDDLKVGDAVLLVNLLQRKAAENNRVLKSDAWTPRKVDKILWTYGR